MKTSEYPEGTGSLEIGIELALANNVTKSVRRLTQGGTLIFKNTSGQLLTIHSDNTPEPFVVPPSTTPVATFTVNSGDTKPVRVANAYGPGTYFIYTAQIGSATPEDPIVIIERR